MEPYVNLPEKTQLQLAAILTLSSNPRQNRGKLISLSYTDSETKYSEKILNLKWSLYGDWRIVNFLSHFGEESGVKEFNDLLSVTKKIREDTEGYRKYEDNLSRIFSFSKEVEVRGRDFETGIDNLFLLLSSVYVKGEITFPSIVICKKVHKINNSYDGFWWVPQKAGFASLLNPRFVPDYARKFFDSMPKKLEI